MPDTATKQERLLEAWEVAHHCHNHLSLLLELLRRCHGYGEMIGEGYVRLRPGDRHEELTTMGNDALAVARMIASSSREFLSEISSARIAHRNEAYDLVQRVADFFVAAEASLTLMTEGEHRHTAPRIADALFSRGEQLRKRAREAVETLDKSHQSAPQDAGKPTARHLLSLMETATKEAGRLREWLPAEEAETFMRSVFDDLENATACFREIVEEEFDQPFEDLEALAASLRGTAVETESDTSAAPALHHATEALKALAWVPPESDDTPFTVIQDARAQLVNVVDTLRAEVEYDEDRVRQWMEEGAHTGRDGSGDDGTPDEDADAATTDTAPEPDPNTLLPAGRYAVERDVPGFDLRMGDVVDLEGGRAARFLSKADTLALRSEYAHCLRKLAPRKEADGAP